MSKIEKHIAIFRAAEQLSLWSVFAGLGLPTFLRTLASAPAIIFLALLGIPGLLYSCYQLISCIKTARKTKKTGLHKEFINHSLPIIASTTALFGCILLTATLLHLLEAPVAAVVNVIIPSLFITTFIISTLLAIQQYRIAMRETKNRKACTLALTHATCNGVSTISYVFGMLTPSICTFLNQPFPQTISSTALLIVAGSVGSAALITAYRTWQMLTALQTNEDAN
jgi:hypothetical protein